MRRTPVLPAAALAALLGPAAARAADVAYLYGLSDFSGVVPFNAVRLHVDRRHNEVFVVERTGVRVFNETGMEIYRFGQDVALGGIRDLVVDGAGEIWVLSRETDLTAGGPPWYVTRCNYRGGPEERLALEELPASLTGFNPDRLLEHRDRLLLASTVDGRVAVVDRTGAVVRARELHAEIGVDERDRPNADLGGISIDARGNLLLTVPVLFRAFVVSPRGEVTAFGKPGSSPGSFGVLGGIVADDHGNLLIADKLRCVVMLFDRHYNFVTEFGYYGSRPDNLVRPSELAVGNGDRLFVTQLRDRGISVFSVTSRGVFGSAIGTRQAKGGDR